MNIPDRISESLETNFGLEILKFFDADPGPGSFDHLSGIEKIGSGSGINVPDPQHCLKLSGFYNSADYTIR
jgi:hypothetical protein